MASARLDGDERGPHPARRPEHEATDPQSTTRCPPGSTTRCELERAAQPTSCSRWRCTPACPTSPPRSSTGPVRRAPGSTSPTPTGSPRRPASRSIAALAPRGHVGRPPLPAHGADRDDAGGLARGRLGARSTIGALQLRRADAHAPVHACRHGPSLVSPRTGHRHHDPRPARQQPRGVRHGHPGGTIRAAMRCTPASTRWPGTG